MLFKCPDCGRVKHYNQWVLPTRKMEQEIERYDGEITVIPVKCPKCKVKK